MGRRDYIPLLIIRSRGFGIMLVFMMVHHLDIRNGGILLSNRPRLDNILITTIIITETSTEVNTKITGIIYITIKSTSLNNSTNPLSQITPDPHL